MDKSQQIAIYPAEAGFELRGYAVRIAAMADIQFIREWRMCHPHAGIVTTKKDADALVFDQRKTAMWLAAKLGGEVAEVWESITERLVCWGDQIPPHRRLA